MVVISADDVAIANIPLLVHDTPFALPVQLMPYVSGAPLTRSFLYVPRPV